jgi:uncharacterized protein (DUF983 family)
MIISKDGYCPTCHEGDVVSTGFLDSIHFFKCNQCNQHYGFNVKEIDVDELPFTSNPSSIDV